MIECSEHEVKQPGDSTVTFEKVRQQTNEQSLYLDSNRLNPNILKVTQISNPNSTN
jgi:hypothetical protein